MDIAVICEAPLANPRPAATLIEPELSWVSAGELPTKGLAVAGFTHRVAPRQAASDGGRWTLAADVESGPSVLAIWSCPREKAASTYSEQVLRSLDANADWLAGGDVIVAGDFNVGQGMTEGSYNDWAGPVRERWESLGLVSVYHEFLGETFGRASRPTYFHKRKADGGFHIDYVLVHHRRLHTVKAVEVGSYEEWVAPGFSDHVPVLVDLDW